MENQAEMNGNIPQEIAAPIVDTPETKTRKFSSIVMIIMSILMLGGVGFGVYGMFFQEKEECPKCEECEKCEDCKECEHEETAARTYADYANEILASGMSRRVVSERSPAGESMEQEFIGTIDGDNKLTVGRRVYKYNGVSMVLSREEGSSREIDGDVVNVFCVSIGNGFASAIIYTKADGSVYWIDSENLITDAVEISTRLDSISSVVNVFAQGGSGGYFVMAVDIDGNIMKIPFTELMK